MRFHIEFLYDILIVCDFCLFVNKIMIIFHLRKIYFTFTESRL